MKYETFLDALEIHQTDKDSRIDLALYLYPDGHGNIYNRSTAGKWVYQNKREVATPFNNLDEGLAIFRDIMSRGIELSTKPGVES